MERKVVSGGNKEKDSTSLSMNSCGSVTGMDDFLKWKPFYVLNWNNEADIGILSLFSLKSWYP